MLRAFGDSNVFGEFYGAEPVAVVWLHGWARRGEDFSTAARILAERHLSSVALDLPGFGASPPPGVAGGARHYAALVAPILRALSSGPLVVVGHSFGGSVATVLAAEHPDLVSALVLIGPPLLSSGPRSKPPRAFRWWRWLHRHGLLSNARLERARQRYGSSDYRRVQGVMRDVLVASVNESYEAELAALSVPVTFLWGELDGEVPVSVAVRARSYVTAPSSLRVLDGVGHLVPLEAPEALVESVMEVAP